MKIHTARVEEVKPRLSDNALSLYVKHYNLCLVQNVSLSEFVVSTPLIVELVFITNLICILFHFHCDSQYIYIYFTANNEQYLCVKDALLSAMSNVHGNAMFNVH